MGTNKYVDRLGNAVVGGRSSDEVKKDRNKQLSHQ